MKLLKKKGFTLIELLVVITIIGILATGAVAMYTGYIQKARDTGRINDIGVLNSAVTQYYGDSTDSTYPATAGFTGAIAKYIQWGKMPVDPKTTQTCVNSKCDYVYNVWPDTQGIASAAYEVSTAFENAGNVTGKAGADNGGDVNRWEVWANIATIDTSYSSGGTLATGAVIVK